MGPLKRPSWLVKSTQQKMTWSWTTCVCVCMCAYLFVIRWQFQFWLVLLPLIIVWWWHTLGIPRSASLEFVHYPWFWLLKINLYHVAGSSMGLGFRSIYQWSQVKKKTWSIHFSSIFVTISHMGLNMVILHRLNVGPPTAQALATSDARPEDRSAIGGRLLATGAIGTGAVDLESCGYIHIVHVHISYNDIYIYI